MKSSQLLIEPLVIGSGATTVGILVGIIVFGVDPQYVEYHPLAGILISNPALLFLLLLGFVYVSGIIMEALSSLIFRGWENSLRKGIQPMGMPKEQKRSIQYFDQLKLFMHTQEASMGLVQYFHANRSRIRISRAWILNSFLIALLLIYKDGTLDEFHPLLIPGILMMGLTLLGSMVTWYVSVSNEVDWMRKFDENLLR